MWALRRRCLRELALHASSMLAPPACPSATAAAEQPLAACRQLALLRAWQGFSSSGGSGTSEEAPDAPPGVPPPSPSPLAAAAAAGASPQRSAGGGPMSAAPPGEELPTSETGAGAASSSFEPDDLRALPRTEPRWGLTGSEAWAPYQGAAPEGVFSGADMEEDWELPAQVGGGPVAEAPPAGDALASELPAPDQPPRPPELSAVDGQEGEEEEEEGAEVEALDQLEGSEGGPPGGVAIPLDIPPGVPRPRVREVDEQGRAYATGRRKTAVACVWMFEGTGTVTVNRRALAEYFPAVPKRADIFFPFQVTGTLGQFDVTATVRGGGQSGQSQAIRHGISQALQKWEPAWRPPLKACGLLTRDPREVERKKPGRKKARKEFQWVKR